MVVDTLFASTVIVYSRDMSTLDSHSDHKTTNNLTQLIRLINSLCKRLSVAEDVVKVFIQKRVD